MIIEIYSCVCNQLGLFLIDSVGLIFVLIAILEKTKVCFHSNITNIWMKAYFGLVQWAFFDLVELNNGMTSSVCSHSFLLFYVDVFLYTEQTYFSAFHIHTVAYFIYDFLNPIHLLPSCAVELQLLLLFLNDFSLGHWQQAAFHHEWISRHLSILNTSIATSLAMVLQINCWTCFHLNKANKKVLQCMSIIHNLQPLSKLITITCRQTFLFMLISYIRLLSFGLSLL